MPRWDRGVCSHVMAGTPVSEAYTRNVMMGVVQELVACRDGIEVCEYILTCIPRLSLELSRFVDDTYGSFADFIKSTCPL